MENPLRTFVTANRGKLTLDQAIKALGSEQAVLEAIADLPERGDIKVVYSGSEQAGQPAKPVLICTEAHYQALFRPFYAKHRRPNYERDPSV